MLSFGPILKNLRTQSHMTQLDLSKKLNVSRATIGRYENDERFPDKETLIKLADIFDVSLDYLFGRSYKNLNIPKNNLTSKSSSEFHKTMNFLNENFSSIMIENLEKLNLSIDLLNDTSFINNVITYGFKVGLKIYLLEKDQNL